MRLAVDVGGTFIDFVCQDEKTGQVRTEKIRSSGDLSERMVEGVAALGIDMADLNIIVHGSTMAINSIVQEKGARVGLITTAGFRDVLELGRGSRVEIYNLFYKPQTPIVPRHRRTEVRERLDARGAVVEPLDEEAVRRSARELVAAGADSIAICFLHAYANPVHERRAADIVRASAPGMFVSISSDIVREHREFERTSTTVLNSFIQPKMSRYLSSLESRLNASGFHGTLTVMQSTGGITTTEIARAAPIRAVQSGPAGGVIGARRLSQRLAGRNFVVADLGGTTFDVSLVQGGRYFERSDVMVNRRPILQPSIDIVSIGAGGGSIVSLDAENGLRVGPESAEADPGPVCYGFGGQAVTLTDALFVLGYFDPETYLGRRMKIDVAAAERAIETVVASRLGMSTLEAAAGIVHIATMNMAYAIRQITIERGFDPREFSMLCIGGGSGLFAGGLLEEVKFASVTVPPNPAVFSAWGLLNADYREDLSRSFSSALNEHALSRLTIVYSDMEKEARDAIAAMSVDKVRIERSCEMRYEGQAHTVRVEVEADDLARGAAGVESLRELFSQAYLRTYSHVLRDKPLEITALRLAAIGETGKPEITRGTAQKKGPTARPSGVRRIAIGSPPKVADFPFYDRAALEIGTRITGPVVIEEWNSTIVALPGQAVTVDEFGQLLLEKLP
jgi:N-methylhydantoinase A